MYWTSARFFLLDVNILVALSIFLVLLALACLKARDAEKLVTIWGLLRTFYKCRNNNSQDNLLLLFVCVHGV